MKGRESGVRVYQREKDGVVHLALEGDAAAGEWLYMAADSVREVQP